MITVIAGTNRKDSRTGKLALRYFEIIRDLTQEACKFFTLEDLPPDFITTNMYESEFQNKALGKIQDVYFTPADKLVFIVPEYNGSFPGIFKLFLDAISIRNYDDNFKNKKVSLIGVATGRGGNLRGLDHLTTSLNYLKMIIFPNRLPISNVEAYMDDEGKIKDHQFKSELQKHALEFLQF